MVHVAAHLEWNMTDEEVSVWSCGFNLLFILCWYRICRENV